MLFRAVVRRNLFCHTSGKHWTNSTTAKEKNSCAENITGMKHYSIAVQQNKNKLEKGDNLGILSLTE